MKNLLRVLLLGCFLLLPGQAWADITSSLDLWWRFSDGSGTSATDSSGNGRTGTLVNTPTWGIGKLGGGLAFLESSNEHITLGSNDLARNVSGATAAAWFKTTDPGSVVVAVEAGTANASRLYILVSLGSPGQIVVGGRAGDAESFQSVTTTSTFDDGAWHHVVGVFSYAADSIVVYVDGSAVSTTGTVSFTASVTSDTAAQDTRVATGLGGANDFDGDIDEVRIYSRALSAGDVDKLYRYPWAGSLVNGAPVGSLINGGLVH